MDKKQWQEVVKEIYHVHMAPKLRGISRRFHPFEWMEFYPHALSELIRASRAMRFIDDQLEADDDLLSVFKREYIQGVFQNLQNGFQFNERYVLKTGIADVMQEFFADIVSELDVSDLPEQDLEALREAGSRHPEGELHLCLMQVKKLQTIRAQGKFINQHPDFRHAIERAGKEINFRREKFDPPEKQGPEPEEESISKGAIMKGMGNICRGTVLVAVDISLMAGMWSVPLSPDTTKVGAVASVVTGLGDIVVGIGEMMKD
jgi:hypothetical protein